MWWIGCRVVGRVHLCSRVRRLILKLLGYRALRETGQQESVSMNLFQSVS